MSMSNVIIVMKWWCNCLPRQTRAHPTFMDASWTSEGRQGKSRLTNLTVWGKPKQAPIRQ